MKGSMLGKRLALCSLKRRGERTLLIFYHRGDLTSSVESHSLLSTKLFAAKTVNLIMVEATSTDFFFSFNMHNEIQ